MKLESNFRHRCKKIAFRTSNKCKCCSSLQCCKLCKRYKFFLGFYQPLFYFFTSLGLNISPKHLNKKYKVGIVSMLSKTTIILMHCFWIYRVAVCFYFRVLYAGYTFKTASYIVLRESFVMMIWYSVNLKRLKIAKLLSKLQKLTELLPTPIKTHRSFYTILGLIYTVPIVISFLMTATLTEQEADEYEYITTFGFVSEDSHFLNFWMYMAYNFYLLIVPFLVTTMYAFICIFVCNMLEYCLKTLQNCKEFDSTMQKICNILTEIFYFIDAIEDALSSCIFFVISQNLILSFTSFAYFMGYYDMTLSATTGMIFWCFGNTISFIFVVWHASKVNAKVFAIKKTLPSIISHVVKINENNCLSIYPQFVHFDVTMLTGWQVFVFSRGLVLYAFGSILTYGLLILQTTLTIDNDESFINIPKT